MHNIIRTKVVIARSNGVDPDSRVEKEANSLAKIGYDVTILAWDRSTNYQIKEDIKKLSETAVKRISFGAKAEFGVGMKSLKSYVCFQYRLFCWLIKNHREYDIAHFCDFDTAFIGIKAARLFKKKVIFDIFDYNGSDVHSTAGKILKYAEDGIINHADATIICTDERKEQIKGTHPNRLTVIHNTPNNTELIKDDCCNRVNSPIKIAYVGILQDFRLLKEMIHSVENMKDVELHIGGFGKYEGYIKEEAKRYSNIVYYGKLQYKDTIDLENRCDLMTAIYDPSIGNHYYAAPNKFYEALMLGKPLLMVKGTGMSKVIEKNNIGELIEFSEEGFVKGLKKLISRKDEWKEIGARMRAIYQSQYSWEEMEKRLYLLYEDLS